MNATNIELNKATKTSHKLALQVEELAPVFASRAAAHDAGDLFAAQNFADLKAAKLLSAGVPAEFGGAGASYRDLAAMLRTLARSCSGTALAFAMHTHPLAATVWRWNTDKAPVEALLKRIAAEELMLLSTGGNDWLAGSGVAEPAPGGYLFSGRKRFVSGCEAGDILMTMAVQGDTVLHAGIPMKAEGVRIEQTWQTIGMRASGSHDVVLDKVFVPDTAVAVKRPANAWHPFFHLVTMIAFPLIYSVYRGVGEQLLAEVLAAVAKRRMDADVQFQIGQLETQMAAVAAAHDRMLEIAETAKPSPAISAQIMNLKRVVTDNLLALANASLDVAGGSAFYRVNKIERLFRDLQAARYHPFTAQAQQRLTARLALGLDADGKAA